MSLNVEGMAGVGHFIGREESLVVEDRQRVRMGLPVDLSERAILDVFVGVSDLRDRLAVLKKSAPVRARLRRSRTHTHHVDSSAQGDHRRLDIGDEPEDIAPHRGTRQIVAVQRLGDVTDVHET